MRPSRNTGKPSRTRRRIRRVVVLAKPGTPEGQRIAFELGPWLHERGVSVRQ